MHLSEKKAKWKSKKGPFVPNDTTYWFLSPFSCKMAGFPAKGTSAYQLAALLRFPAVQTYVVESGAKWSWAPCIFYLLHFLRSHHHLNVFHICLFSLWFHSSGAAQKTRESSSVIGYSQDRDFFKKWKKIHPGSHQYRQWWCEIVASRISSIGSWRHVTCARSPTWLIFFFLLDLYRLWLKSNNYKRTHPPPSKDFSGIFFLEAVNARRWDQ